MRVGSFYARHGLTPLAAGVALAVCTAAAPAGAANKEHQQMMAEIRMLQLGVLLLQHPDLGHHLLMFLVGRAGRRRRRDDSERDAAEQRREAVAGEEGSDWHV